MNYAFLLKYRNTPEWIRITRQVTLGMLLFLAIAFTGDRQIDSK